MYSPSDIIDIEMLASFLGADISIINNLFYKENYLQRMRIPKKNRHLGFRNVYKLQRYTNTFKALKFELNKLYIPLDCVHGFVRDRGILSNALVHLKKKKILTIDIKDFFETITVSQLKLAYISLGFNDEVATALSKITSHNGILVQGLSTSPILANLVCQDMDRELMEFCKIRNLDYTRYADDITISGDTFGVLTDIELIIEKYKFEINKKKTRYAHKGKSQYVTGLSVSDNLCPRIPRNIKNKIRQNLYYMNKYGFRAHICKRLNINEKDNNPHVEECIWRFQIKLKGWLDFIKSIEPRLAEKYFLQYNNIIKKHKYQAGQRFHDEMEKEMNNESMGLINMQQPQGIKIITKHYIDSIF